MQMNKPQQVIAELYNVVIAPLKLSGQEHFAIKAAFDEAVKVLADKGQQDVQPAA